MAVMTTPGTEESRVILVWIPGLRKRRRKRSSERHEEQGHGRRNLAGPTCVHPRRRHYAHLGTRLSLRLADAAQELAVDFGDFGVPGRRHWGQFGGVQRGGRAVAASASVSAGGAASGGMAAFSSDRNIPRLAFAGPIHRHPE